MSNNYKSPHCEFAEQIVSYLYGECEAREKIRFEAHLNNCSMCADEYAGLGVVRSSVIEWRDADFAKLTTPTFTIPTTAKANVSPAVSTQFNSWFDTFRKMFSFNPAYAALAVALVGVGIALFAFNFSRENQTAEIQNEKDIVQATVSPTAEITKKPENKIAELQDVKPLPPSSPVGNSPKEPKQEKTIEPQKNIVKVSNYAPKNNSEIPAVTPKETIVKKPLPVKKQRVPNLNEIDGDEDESIRLADLFDELDTK